MAAFPSFAPTSRSFTPGTYPQRSYRSLSGVVTKRTFGNAPSQATLDMSFDNVADSTVAAIINHYRNQTAVNRRFQLSAITMGGMDSNLVSIANGTVDNLRFEYKDPPSVQSIRPGRSSVSVSLIGEIRDPRSDD
ncbi:MAG: hypothetical protein EBS18_00400 [Actinobacteria bacterium]|nr:hypothetical protein [Actinomycetota bacterium]